MADLPKWEYIVIILCAEVILGVAITLFVCWKCRWAKRDKLDENDEKKTLPSVDDVMDDMFNKDSSVVVGHAPLKHDYTDISTNPWLLSKVSKDDDLFSVRPKSVGFKNEAFSSFDDDKFVEIIPHTPENEVDLETGEGKLSRLSVSQEEKVLIVSTVTKDNLSQDGSMQDLILSQSTTSADLGSSNSSPIIKHFHSDSVLVVTNHQPSASLQERSLTPVDPKMIDTPIVAESTTNNQSNIREPSPLVVRSADDSHDIFDKEAQWKQFSRDIEMTRSPPPSYQSATGRRTNPQMGQRAILIGDDDETVNTIPDRRAFQPLWENRRRHDLRYV